MLNIIDTLTQKGVSFESQKENINTDTPQGRFVLTVFSTLSELSWLSAILMVFWINSAGHTIKCDQPIAIYKMLMKPLLDFLYILQ